MKFLYISIASLFLLSACSNGNNQPQSNEQAPVSQPETKPTKVAIEPPAEINELLNKHTCLTCHAAGERVVGPAYVEVAKRNYTADEIVSLIYTPKPEHWPDYPPMIGLPKMPKEDALKIANWINSLK